MAARSPYDYPLVSGEYQMTENWLIRLPGEFRRRFEHGSLVIWRPGITVWIDAWQTRKERSQADSLARRKRIMSREAFDVVEESAGSLLRFSYRLREGSGGGVLNRVLGWLQRRAHPDLREARAPSLYGLVAGVTGQVQMAIYFDDEEELPLAMALWRGVEERRAA